MPRDVTELVLELTRPRISTLKIALRQMAEKLRQEAIENLERRGGTPRTVEVRDGRGTHIVTHVRLSRPVKAYVAYDGDRLRLVRNVDEDDLPIDGKERGRGLERRVLEAVERGEAEAYPADLDEVELLPEAARLLGLEKVPLSLMPNLGWLLSDDARKELMHGTAKPGQASVRIIHWLAPAEWAVNRGIAATRPVVFKLIAHYVAQTRKVQTLSLGLSLLDVLLRPSARLTSDSACGWGPRQSEAEWICPAKGSEGGRV